MPEIRERDPNDFIKSKGKGKHRGKKGSIVPCGQGQLLLGRQEPCAWLGQQMGTAP